MSYNRTTNRYYDFIYSMNHFELKSSERLALSEGIKGIPRS